MTKRPVDDGRWTGGGGQKTKDDGRRRTAPRQQSKKGKGREPDGQRKSLTVASLSPGRITAPRPLEPERQPIFSPRSAASRRLPKTMAGAMVAAGGLDYPLIFILATLLAAGLVMVYSASFVQEGSYLFLSQIVWVLLGIGVLFIMANIPYQLWRRWSLPIMALALVLLVAVLIAGEIKFGAKRTLFGGRVQPSEIAKLAVVIYVAAWVSARGKSLSNLQTGLIPFGILMGVVAGLLVLEPSFSVTIIILVIGVTIFFVGGGDTRQLVIGGGIGAVVLFVMITQSQHGIERIRDWWGVITDPSQASEYNILRLMLRRGFSIGFGSNPGEWMVKSYVPLLWSDYLFVNIGHDLGLIGAAGVVGLFAALGYRGIAIALRAPDQFASLTAVGITIWILTQATIHIGVSLAMIPATGQPLPFMSYGGSAMLACMAGIGVLLNISRAGTAERASYADSPIGRRDGGTRLPDPRGSGRTPGQPPTADGRRAARH